MDTEQFIFTSNFPIFMQFTFLKRTFYSPCLVSQILEPIQNLKHISLPSVDFLLTFEILDALHANAFCQ